MIIKTHFAKTSSYLLTLITAFLLICPWAQAQVQVQDVYSRPLPPGQSVASAYMTIKNTSDKALVLVAVSSPLAKSAEFHSHSHDNGMMRMRKMEQVLVEAGKTLRFAPGGYHIMLFGVSQPFKLGDKIPLRLITEAGEEIHIQALVRPYGQ